MGCCCSCLDQDGAPGGANRETELAVAQAEKKALSISRAMSAPSIDVDNGTTVSGFGLAIAGVSIEQDAAYWEVQVDIPDGQSAEIMFGVATKKDQKFYAAFQEQEEDAIESQGTDLLRKLKVKNEDTIGVAVQQDDLPMVQFLLNGEPVDSVNRFRGTVYPAVFLPASEGISVQLVFRESDFQQLPPSARFGPLIVARGLI